MEVKDEKKFELNTKILKNFEEIMAMKLDEIEELKITSLDSSSKLLNVISLCANLKTLIIEGDQRINCDKILLNVFKPEELENLVLNNVKVPKSRSVKRFTNLKMISLNDIRFCNVKDFLSGIENPESIEVINVSETDLANNSIDVLERFCNIKYLNLSNVLNCKLTNLSFIKNNENLLKVDIVNNKIPYKEMNNLLDSKCTKNLELDILNDKEKIIEDAKFTIKNGRKSTITFLMEDINEFAENIKLYKLKNINIIIKKVTENDFYIEKLKETRANIRIIVEDFSCIDTCQAKKIKDVLRLKEIEFVNGDKYEINTYIEIRENIDEIINQISKHVSESEQFLEVYRFFGNEFEIVENEKFDLKNKTCTSEQVAQILRECLKCMNIESNIISGDYYEEGNAHSWNQVKLQKKWYNVDLASDMKNIKKKKARYCLLKDEDFIQTHTPKSGQSNYCGENFNSKLISVFFKTGLFREKLFKSYIELVMEKLKNTFYTNKQEKVLALPSGNVEKNKQSKGK